jgi:glycosyltransferase involved in cell wall biosynthesis
LSPKVSVIIPTYNRAHLVGKAIQSVLDQTFSDFEVIVVDDGSTDNTRKVVSQFKDKVRYIYQDNKGRSAARNSGMRNSRGQYITFLDSDDHYLPDKLRKQVESMDKNPGYAMSFTSSIWLNEEGRYLHTWRPVLNGSIYPELMRVKHNKVALPSVMIHREIPDGGEYFNESLNTCEDLEYWCRIAKEHKVLTIQEGLVIINTDTRPSQAVFYDHFSSTLKYYSNIFNADRSIAEPVKRAIYTDLFVKYYLNATTDQDKKYILSEIVKVKPAYVLPALMKVYASKLFEAARKYNRVRTIFRFCKNYLLIRLPQYIMKEDFEYGVLKELKIPEKAEKVSNYYRKNESGNIYVPDKTADRATRKEVRELLIDSGYLHRNRIAMMLKL